MTGAARYDGLADWYDGEFQPEPLDGEAWETLVGLLGAPVGALLDVARLPSEDASFDAAVSVFTHDDFPVVVQTFLDAGLRLERIEEPERREYAYMLALRWRR